MKHLLLIIVMLNVAFGEDKCVTYKEALPRIKSQVVGNSYDIELLGVKARTTIVDYDCKNNTNIYKINVATNSYVNNSMLNAMKASIYDNIRGDYCYYYIDDINWKYIYYFNDYADTISLIFTKKDCR